MPPQHEQQKRLREEGVKEMYVPLDEVLQKEYGKRLAEAILFEIKAPEKIGHSPIDNYLRKDVPERNELRFIITKGEDLAKAEIVAVSEAEQTREDSKEKLALCFASGFFGPKSFFDVDHMFPFEKIIQRQKALIDYLNDPKNLVLTKAFMGIDPADNEHKEKIQQFFGFCLKEDTKTMPNSIDIDDLRSGKIQYEKVIIKGKCRFFRLCFNDLKNLLPLSHPTNEAKGSHLITECKRVEEVEKNWIQRQPLLGEDCWKKLTEGEKNIHDGVITQRIFNNKDCPSFCIGRYNPERHETQGKKIEVTLYDKKPAVEIKGIGEFIATWFTETHPKYGDIIARIYKDIWEEMQEFANKTNIPEHQSAIEKLTFIIHETIETGKEYYDTIRGRGVLHGGSDTGSDKSGEKVDRNTVRKEGAMKEFDFMHRTKKMYKRLYDLTKLNKDEFAQVRKAFMRLNVYDRERDHQAAFFNELEKQLSRITIDHPLKVDEVSHILEQVDNVTNVNKKLAAATQAFSEEQAARVKEQAARIAVEQEKQEITSAFKFANECHALELEENNIRGLIKEQEHDDRDEIKEQRNKKGGSPAIL